ncbi:MAG: hypothetical protein E4H27_02885 [Anaerolineales bacterium]|nr:MAG: hypothetical protein E4H27_02885 [Anaerolineales bacterium]
MKSRRMKFQMGQWRCAHCGAIWTGSLDLDEDLGEAPKDTETLDGAVETELESDDGSNAVATDEQTQNTENTPE